MRFCRVAASAALTAVAAAGRSMTSVNSCFGQNVTTWWDNTALLSNPVTAFPSILLIPGQLYVFPFVAPCIDCEYGLAGVTVGLQGPGVINFTISVVNVEAQLPSGAVLVLSAPLVASWGGFKSVVLASASSTYVSLTGDTIEAVPCATSSPCRHAIVIQVTGLSAPVFWRMSTPCGVGVDTPIAIAEQPDSLQVGATTPPPPLSFVAHFPSLVVGSIVPIFGAARLFAGQRTSLLFTAPCASPCTFTLYELTGIFSAAVNTSISFVVQLCRYHRNVANPSGPPPLILGAPYVDCQSSGATQALVLTDVPSTFTLLLGGGLSYTLWSPNDAVVEGDIKLIITPSADALWSLTGLPPATPQGYAANATAFQVLPPCNSNSNTTVGIPSASTTPTRTASPTATTTSLPTSELTPPP